ncbi:synovial sarcoma, X breakpoint 2 interacting protein a isoform X1 [Triplophysa dalaica]|uniref:synovial sarcoma, X breakpoint 2 interacting protein a isoform X1 n=1 Tax=Triplophysa dalaica TaxID=1582913 RepID=UPI0024DF3E2B|nr:synovial sarcoma, X breakpoint 2 interacting protein a isoform X1 [Triplophysa dalaica]
MGDWWTPAMMPDPAHDAKDLSSISGISMSPSRQNSHPSLHSTMALPKTSYSVLSAFCTEDNVSQCIIYINQEVCSLGLSGVGLECVSDGLSSVPVLNLLYELLQLQKRSQCALQELENQQLKNNSDLEHLQHSHSRLKDQLEHTRRENSGLHEGERRLQLKIKTLQNCLKSEKDEVQKLQSIISSRATQYNHDTKRKERECTKLKERLNQLLMDKRDKKLTIEVSNYVGRSDGKRGLWKTGKMEARHEGEMYKALLSDYESRQRSLMLENSELKKVLQHMKKDMISILSPKKACLKTEQTDDSLEQVGSEGEEEAADSSREMLEQSCEQAREQLTNSIRLQWRKLKSHMERLDSQASLVACQEREGEDQISRREHEDEIQLMRLEVQQCKDFIHMQQQLLQQQLNSPCDDETAALLNDCYTLEEKERLKEEWRLFNDQKKNFEKERKNFTEAAIRLGHERKAFEDDRAALLKTQFLNMTPFVDRKRPALPESECAFSATTEPEAKIQSTPPMLTKSQSYTSFSTPNAAPVKMPSTADLYRSLRLIPDSRGHSRRQSGETVRSRLRNGSVDCSVFSLVRDENSPI